MKHNIILKSKLYDSGLTASKELADGNVDLATAAEFVVVRNILQGEDIRIISSLSESDSVRLVGRRDHGISRITDIRQKRIGLIRDSGADFFLDLLMVLHKIPLMELHKVDLSFLQQMRAIRDGEIDCVVTWAPYSVQIERSL